MRSAIAVAASAGGVEALKSFVAALPKDFPGTVLVVLHISASGPSVLPEILTRAGPLPATHGVDGQPLRPSTIVVAPPDQHLRVRRGRVLLDRGAKQNGHRPSADALFRSVAEDFGTHGAGVVLSGTMDDGAAGVRAIRAAGGLVCVQDPEEAAFPGMPLAALAELEPDIVAAIGTLVPRLVKWLQGLTPLAEPVDALGAKKGEASGAEASPFTCPDCGGTLYVGADVGMDRFRCRVGHSYSSAGLLAGKKSALESALWAAVVALEERSELCGRLVERLEYARGSTTRIERYRSEIAQSAANGALLRELINDLIRRSAEEQGGERHDVEATR